MARRTGTAGANIQTYPRIQDDNRQTDLLDDAALQPHTQRMSLDALKGLVRQAIVNANQKSSRAILNIPDGASQAEIEKTYRREGANLLKYFRKYCGDPAATAHQVYRKTYREVGVEQFRNRTLQKERMNSVWRYRFLVAASVNASDIETMDMDDALQSLYAAFGRENVNRALIDVIMEAGEADPLGYLPDPPSSLIEAFGEACRQSGLIDEDGRFHDPHRLVEFFCN